MSSAAPQFEIGAVVLGYVGTVASWRRPTLKSNRFGPMLTIQTCSSADDGLHTPAASVTISNREAMLALRQAIDEALKEPQS